MKKVLIIVLGILSGLILLLGISSKVKTAHPNPQVQGIETQVQSGQSIYSPAIVRLKKVSPSPVQSQAPVTYTNPMPTHNPSLTPNTTGATAICNDGTYSYSQNRRGTCSHHGGVAQWL